ncbi:MAG: M28 family peptidase, partial [Bacteroidota bacterium]
KVAMVKEMGGLALIELYRSSELPWSLLQNYFSGTKFTLEGPTGEAFSSGLINDANGEWLKYFTDKKKLKTAEISISGANTTLINVPNVVGWIEGTDPELKDEYLLISAHFDHVGVKEVPADEDSIWNGARDNAIGTTALLQTAKFFGLNPQGRSILFLACNAEEVGLLGSRYYSENPLLPLDKAIFNFNNDGAGYNNKELMTVIGLERTGAEEMIMDAATAFGLTAIQDPVPEQNLFDRSDNVSFAAKGVPAITCAPGADDFDEEVLRYYHQPADEAGSLDYEYLSKYYKSYIYAAYQILNSEESLFWSEGDKYEEVGKELYGRQ